MNLPQATLWVFKDIFTNDLVEVASFILFFHVMLTIHEGAHAVVGALCGVPSTGIRIGDKPLFTIHVLGYKVALGWRPSSGHTTFVDEGRFPDSWAVFMTYLAGPLAVVCTGPVFFLLCRHNHFLLAVSFGALFSFCGIYDLRKSCPDGAAIRRLWKVLRARSSPSDSLKA
jgi:hypothetical protein